MNSSFDDSRGDSKCDSKNVKIEDTLINKDDAKVLRQLKIKHLNKLVVGHLNINSLPNKFDCLKEFVKHNIDILMISETKLDCTFPGGQFLIDGFNEPFRFDRNRQGGWIMLYVREDIPAKLLKVQLDNDDIESFFVELNLRAHKWLLSCSYNPKFSLIQSHLNSLSKVLDFYSSKYENFIVMGDFNVECSNEYLDNFCQCYNLESINREPTCFKSLTNPSCIDLILTNRPNLFYHSKVIETGLSDFHKLVASVLKIELKKQKPKIVFYRNYKKFDNELFRTELIEKLSLLNINGFEFENCNSAILKVLDKHAPRKRKYVRANQSEFMNKELSKAIMTRSRFLNRYRKNPTHINKTEYKKKRNFCVSLLRKTKKKFFNTLDVRNITDNKKFWKVIKPNFSDKSSKTNAITLVVEEKIVSGNQEIADNFNSFFGNIVPNLNIKPISSCENIDLLDEPIENSIRKYKNHPSIIKIFDARKNT